VLITYESLRDRDSQSMIGIRFGHKKINDKRLANQAVSTPKSMATPEVQSTISAYFLMNSLRFSFGFCHSSVYHPRQS